MGGNIKRRTILKQEKVKSVYFDEYLMSTSKRNYSLVPNWSVVCCSINNC